jgi:hypothetical protein
MTCVAVGVLVTTRVEFVGHIPDVVCFVETQVQTTDVCFALPERELMLGNLKVCTVLFKSIDVVKGGEFEEEKKNYCYSI